MNRKETTEEKQQVIELRLKVWPGGSERLCITHANRDNDLHLNHRQSCCLRVFGVYGVISELYKPLLDRSHLDEPCLLLSATGLGITSLPSVSLFAVYVSPPLLSLKSQWYSNFLRMLSCRLYVTNTFL